MFNMKDDYTHKKGIVYKNQFHIIFCPKYRRKVLVNGVDERLKENMEEKTKPKKEKSKRETRSWIRSKSNER